MNARNLPNLIIAGVNKGGTTSLFSYLSKHPDVCASSVKETCFFLPLRYDESIPPLDLYAKYFRHHKGEKYLLEATPGYVYGGVKIAGEIRRLLGDVRILVMLRNPVDRLASFYKFKKSTMELEKDLTFDRYMEICETLNPKERLEQRNNRYWGIEGGFYVEYLMEWWDVFGDGMKVLFFDRLKESPILLLQEICSWLDIDPGIFDHEQLGVENKTMNFKHGALHRLALLANVQGEKFFRSHPRGKDLLRKIYYAVNGAPHSEIISRRTLTYLNELYRPHNERLANELMKRGYCDLPGWLGS